MEPNTISPSIGKLAGPGELLKSAWDLFKKNWRMLIMIAAVPAALTLVGQLFSTGGALLAAVAAILVIAGVVLSLAMQGAMIDAVRQYSINPSAILTVKGQYKFGFKYFWPLILVVIIEMFVLGGSTILFVIPGIIIAVYTIVYVMALLVDDKRGFSALTESWRLVKGHWWGVLGRMIILLLVVLAVYAVVGGLLLPTGALVGGGANSPVAKVFSFVFGAIVSLIVGPFATVYIYKLYESLKKVRGQDVSAAAFKKWLIVFLCVGALAVVGIIVTVPFAIKASLEQVRERVENT